MELTPPGRHIYPKVPLGGLEATAITAAALPPSVDLSKLPPVDSQGQAGSCVGWSSSYYFKSIQEGADQGWALTESAHQFSPNYVWNQIQPNPGKCGGTYLGDAVELITKQGDTTLSLFPYTQDCAAPITLSHKDAAANYRGESFGAFFQYGSSATDAEINKMKQWLAGGDPILIGVPVLPEFDEPSGPYCIVDLPTQGESRGGHAITIVGYNDNIGSTGKSGFKIVNSWGTDYGCQGFAYLTYNWFKKYADEAWWMRDIRTGGNTTRDFTIFNDGTSTLTINSINKGASAWLELNLPKATPIHLEPGENVTIGLTVNANSAVSANYNETISITSNDPTQSLIKVNVTLQTGVTAGAPPSQVSGPQPPDGAIDQPIDNVNLSWASASGTTALLYDTRLEQSSPPARIVCNDRPGVGCTVSNLKPRTVYYWRVVTSDKVNATLSSVWKFETTGGANWMPRAYLPIIVKGK